MSSSLSTSTSNPLPRTRPIDSSDPHNDLRVVWDATWTGIISDKRPSANAKTISTVEDK